MKAIMISIKPKWCVQIMNGEKTIEVRKNKALASAIQKLIDKYGYADIYVYCSKNGVDRNGMPTELVDYRGYAIYNRFQLMPKCSKATSDDEQPRLNGKVLFKFRCYKVEEVKFTENEWHGTKEMPALKVLDKSCLTYQEITNYLNGTGFAIHISDLEIFDEPKELWEFESTKQHLVGVIGQTQPILQNIRLTKAPQNFCYVEAD